jgi:DNA modification methylase
LRELHRVLKETGSIYLHCDPTASHYLKIVMDAVFGGQNFRNEISWRRSSAHSDVKQGMKRCGRIRDVLLFYTKSAESVWNAQYTPYTPEYVESEYRHVDPEGRRYKETDLTAARPGGDTEFEWRVMRPEKSGYRWQPDFQNEYLRPRERWEYKGVPPYNGRYWAYSKQNIVEFAGAGKIIHRETGMPRLMQFSNEMPGIPLQDDWGDINRTSGEEDLGYPTQKPEALLDRIVLASSNEGDVVLDPFCGCGTTIQMAQRRNRRWIGIDVTHLSLAIMKGRLVKEFGPDIFKNIEVIGEPVTEEEAFALAASDKFGFQCWAVGRIGAPPIEHKKGADRGIDGRIYFHDDLGAPKHIVISVKAGDHIGPAFVRELRGVVDREKAEMGILVCAKEPTSEMKKEAAQLGWYKSLGGNFPRMQIITLKDIFANKPLNVPVKRINPYERKGPQSVRPAAEQLRLLP